MSRPKAIIPRQLTDAATTRIADQNKGGCTAYHILLAFTVCRATHSQSRHSAANNRQAGKTRCDGASNVLRQAAHKSLAIYSPRTPTGDRHPTPFATGSSTHHFVGIGQPALGLNGVLDRNDSPLKTASGVVQNGRHVGRPAISDNKLAQQL